MSNMNQDWLEFNKGVLVDCKAITAIVFDPNPKAFSVTKEMKMEVQKSQPFIHIYVQGGERPLEWRGEAAHKIADWLQRLGIPVRGIPEATTATPANESDKKVSG